MMVATWSCGPLADGRRAVLASEAFWGQCLPSHCPQGAAVYALSVKDVLRMAPLSVREFFVMPDDRGGAL